MRESVFSTVVTWSAFRVLFVLRVGRIDVLVDLACNFRVSGWMPASGVAALAVCR